ncbi:MAG: triose-phosphate isomerase [Candidatus Kerfeldbacteria bacterium RIFCSPLOWO2_01_FULL_48_11]|uniref:Triosephosphate isomerase n=1 Tax=Candidatus Kerfeldbacteria bacterium RIFCSPLOWO2_01_FULL_48_11 TaxID=1798543 RepID=A0A1G2B719_9BACT|nr:MAG: Triosephosphate isomerase [Parcubacteria group bacterium GW2011_GWA2_48_9]KKW15780.1 MAG: Triosephosphate isomerase [Parcubacteria group bacterium GW2011_GWC2_49_9]OGY84409.1 MAG: triose-phosphate isomerase [Candidatus Kerfeldbacteria bacterium RIFCSPLOWO2_01_FULL_48_11]HCJ52231.1 triose-phosphate isomerase [Candidatus Kerfeldbacteria bacterium]HCM68095.1 triose-phosphate isomerase [Candidatus Kerfeldbacteria bacterium]
MASHPIVVGNWKMNLNSKQTGELIMSVKKEASKHSSVSVIVAPSFTYLDSVGKILKGSKVQLAGQNMFWESEGAYTGEISAPMLMESGCSHVIIGHSERRKYLRETDHMIHRKMVQALECGLVPIVCIGETFEQRQQGIKDLVVMQQLQAIFGGLIPTEKQNIVIAYEPIWAVGTGQACDPNEARETIQVLKHALIDMYQEHVVQQNFVALYGGSVDHTTITQYVDGDIINGVLVGGASTRLDSMLGMIRAVDT